MVNPKKLLEVVPLTFSECFPVFLMVNFLLLSVN